VAFSAHPLVDRPELEEFLSALDGFLETQASPATTSHLKFLEIFCRSVGSNEGQLLKYTADGTLASEITFGIEPGFDQAFNKARAAAPNQHSPLDAAFHNQKVVAIVEIEKDPNSPPWFMDIMRRYGFKSLVAVPLLGHARPVGILCAYYRDVCLFDQGTLERMQVIGRMVGAATENSTAAGRVESQIKKIEALDELIRVLTGESFEKSQVYGQLMKAVAQCFPGAGAATGPVSHTSDGVSLILADGIGFKSDELSHKIRFPAFLRTALEPAGEPGRTGTLVQQREWGDLGRLVKGERAFFLAAPLMWGGKIGGALIVWRAADTPFDKTDGKLLERLAGIGSLALR